MKRNSAFYILVFTAGVLIIFWLVRNRDPFGKGNTSFAVEGDKDITRIELVSRDGKVKIEKSGEGWVVGRNLEARKSAVMFIIKTLREIKIKSPVSADIFRKEIIEKNVEPVRVSVFEKKRLIKSFYVYKTPSNLYGNIMKLKVSSKPYIVYLPGYENNIGSYFVVNELFWKTFSAIRLLPSQIGYVELKNFSDTASSFSIESNKGRFLLKESASAGQDSDKVRRYISYFVNVPFESWAFDLSPNEKKEIESSEPLFRISIRTTTGGAITLTIWEREIPSGEGGLTRKDTDRVWGKLNDDKGIFVMRYFDIDPILKKKSWFSGN
jgi:hypothetical protein